MIKLSQFLSIPLSLYPPKSFFLALLSFTAAELFILLIDHSLLSGNFIFKLLILLQFFIHPTALDLPSPLSPYPVPLLPSLSSSPFLPPYRFHSSSIPLFFTYSSLSSSPFFLIQFNLPLSFILHLCLHIQFPFFLLYPFHSSSILYSVQHHLLFSIPLLSTPFHSILFLSLLSSHSPSCSPLL